jgi:hypothetical protein
MKWVVLFIAVTLPLYTLVTLYYRKPPGQSHQPYQEARERAGVARVEAAGYTRIEASATRPADIGLARNSLDLLPAVVHGIPGGLPAELEESFARFAEIAPKLPESFGEVAAPAVLTPPYPYQMLYTCRLPTHSDLLGDIRVYIKGDRIAIITDHEPIPRELLSRSREASVFLSIEASAFAAGRTYEITLVGAHTSKSWTMSVTAPPSPVTPSPVAPDF